ncbi:hypothetical protein V8J88_18815 [Massilia sp. W12]|uniref:hypothetical protein n=1 Tax=Massilia sp. W12 TaxID=3126507 RepID=UPI0030D545E2
MTFVGYLKCTGCAQRFDFPVDSQYSYTDLLEHWCDAPSPWPLRIMPMEVRPVWCLRCDGPAFVECLPARQQLLDIAALRRLPSQQRPAGMLYHCDDGDFLWLAQHCLQRSAPPRCLSCGDSYWIALEARETGMRHESCWGSPIEYHCLYFVPGTPSQSNWWGRALYDVNGVFCGMYWELHCQTMQTMPMLFGFDRGSGFAGVWRACLTTLLETGHAAALAQLQTQAPDTKGEHALLQACLMMLGGERYPLREDGNATLAEAHTGWRRAAAAGNALGAWNLAQWHSSAPLQSGAKKVHARYWQKRANALGLHLALA